MRSALLLFVCVGAFAASLAAPTARAQNLFESDGGSGNIYEFTPSGQQSTFATGLNEPESMAFNSAGDLFVGEHEDVWGVWCQPAGWALI